jgi:hypothetical protein
VPFRRTLLLAAMLVLLVAGPAHAQLAPCDPSDYQCILDRDQEQPDVEVVDVGEAEDAGDLARTGTNIVPLIQAAIVLVGGGTLLLLVARRRRAVRRAVPA